MFSMLPLRVTIMLIKVKFHYADFVTFTETSPREKSWSQIMKVRDTNHVADFHDLCPQQSLPTFPVHCNIVTNFPRALLRTRFH